MFLSHDNSQASSPTQKDRDEKRHKKLVKRTRQLKQTNQELAARIAECKRLAETVKQYEAQLKLKTEQLEQALCELQQTKNQLIHNNKIFNLGQLVACVAHDINNPVNFVYGNLTPASQYAQDLLNLLKLYAKHYPQPVPEVQQQVQAIDLDFLMEDFPKTLSSMYSGADRIRKIVKSLHNFARLDSNKTFVDLHQEIDSTLLIINNLFKAKGDNPEISVVKDYGNLPLIECYPGLLNQVFMNLLCNAADALQECNQKPCGVDLEKSHLALSIDCCTASVATNSASSCDRNYKESSLIKQNTQHHHTIAIRTEVRQGNPVEDNGFWAVIRISDNGPGITEKIRSRIFEPFFTTKSVGKGTGLGLFISHQIISENHNGTLKCLCEPGLGTEFVIEIPIQQSGYTRVCPENDSTSLLVDTSPGV